MIEYPVLKMPLKPILTTFLLIASTLGTHAQQSSPVLRIIALAEALGQAKACGMFVVLQEAQIERWVDKTAKNDDQRMLRRAIFLNHRDLGMRETGAEPALCPAAARSMSELPIPR